jgi:hypothetical protein
MVALLETEPKAICLKARGTSRQRFRVGELPASEGRHLHAGEISSESLLRAADNAILRTLSRDSRAFLESTQQAEGE